ncbi:translocation/assembly module TamB domain-containing protein [Leisingera sp. McT4-56]|uniref:translocation/assembly module TamB domain-containing protein n=1 Tax=Leisingera sp. McT4-56 TaxID=2881255 RepID=UPI001CF8399D|nr:translocation/assembly module TamB domain-containing protein [Leisingera sp. McT4-56]MCB4457429.1 translocation/assembly module TamB domain-containing protein [Leisingera sp. McT4-56]
MRQHLAFFLAAGLTALPAAAQETATEGAGGLLVDFLEDTLSGDSRYISVSGLEGAFSSQAKIKKITVADEEGIWLTVEGAVLDWNRLELLRGRFSVNELSAERIEVARAPEPLPPDPELPEAETTPFALPELPVAIELGQIKAARIELGEALAGTAASLRVEGSLKLADGALDTKLEAARLDKPGDHLRLEAGYANETQQITLDLSADEAPGGLISRGLDLPGNPDLQLTAKGSGPVTDFTADITFSTNGTERLGGQVVLAARPLPQDAAPEAPRDIGFSADLGGNIDVLLPPVHRPFFGPGLRLNVKGVREGSGAMTLDTLVLHTNALRITGAAALDAGGKLATANLKTAITPPAGQAAAALPFGGGQTTLAKADLQLQKTLEGRWVLDGVVNQLSHPGALVDTAGISGRGTLDQTSGFKLEGRVTAGLSGFQPRDPALAKATGNEIRFEGTLSTDGPGALHITDMELRGSDYQAAGDVAFDGLEEGLKVTADLTAGAADLGRFSDLAGRPLGGAVQAAVKGSFTPLTGGFDTDLSLQAQDLSAGIAQADELLAGTTTLDLKAARDENGIAIDRFALAGSALEAEAAGTLSNQSGQMDITARLTRLEVLLPQAPGTLELATTLGRAGDTFSGVAELKGPHTSSAKLDGSVTLAGDADFTFAAAWNELERFVPQLAGRLSAEGTAERRNGEWQVAGTAAGPAGIAVETEARFTESNGSTDLRFDAVIAELQQLVPDLPGRLAATGTAARRDGTWTVDSTASGPAGIDSRIEGSWNEAEGTADVTARGTLRLEGLNPFLSPNLMQGPANFDMALRGVPALDGVSGTISVPGASLAIPAAAQRVDDINATVSIASSSAQLQLSARPRDGGTVRISGPVGLLPPFNGNLQIAIGDVVVTDHLSYETLLNGSLAMSGAMAGDNKLAGRINVGETNINLNTAGGSVSSAPIPPVRHAGAPRDVRQTLARAGLTGNNGGGGGSGRTALDVLIDAPSRIFARGRGLRAELGGQIRVRGSTARPSPSGQISLIRGTFDILGRRLELDEGRITLLGDLKPYLEFKSTAATGQGTATLEISGRVDAPEIKVTSDPPRPSEEALALLLFGDNIGDLSPLALARLAGSALTLSGRGGGAQSKVRQATGADTVDIGTDNLGTGQLGLGGYVAENVYTDFNVNTQGDSELSINLDITKSLTVQGTVDSEGETGLGLFFKRDY